MDLLGSLETIDKAAIIDWIYALQYTPISDDDINHCGFRGGSFMGNPFDSSSEIRRDVHAYDSSHIAMTYTALATLKIFGDDFSKIQKDVILRALTSLQLSDGSFVTTIFGSENDLRFTYCAAAICHILDDWSCIDVDKAVEFIIKCQTYEGGIGLNIGFEAHGGSTYCGVAALSLMNRLEDLPNKKGLIEWCVGRMVGGFQGRCGKDPDCCYTFWIGASLSMLGKGDLIHKEPTRKFTISCAHDTYGGFAKYPGLSPDVLHAYMGLAGLSVMGDDSLSRLEPRLNISLRASLL